MIQKTNHPLTDEERLDWLCLSRTERIGPITFFHLLKRFGSAGKALEALPDLSHRGGKKIKKFPRDRALRELEQLHKISGTLLAACEPAYPTLLSHIEDAPPVLSVLGSLERLHHPSIAIVGTRNASTLARHFAEELSEQVSAAGFIVISGLARGIDTYAHQGALNNGTVAVLAGGINIVYPQQNYALYEAIVKQGAIVAESPFDTQSKATLFPKRNRIISGLSQATLVIEAALRSGSLITARLALEQGRDVMAVPGFPKDPRNHGSNKLIQQGATLVQNFQDVLDVLSPLFKSTITEPLLTGYTEPDTEEWEEETSNNAHDTIFEKLTTSPVNIDTLIRDIDLPAPLVLSTLLELELAGRVERQAGNRVSLL